MNFDVNEVTQLVNSVGFPIVCCGVLFWNNYKLTSTITELTSTLKVIDERIEKLENKFEK
ncbi:MAG: hypothetical protein J6D47_03665 [Peptostreptococcaceae bacterium]|nr:hypothetical protein [Peptostreptococcaceae bacterium]